MRSSDEIRADLAVERSATDRREWSAAAQRLLADVPLLLGAVERISAAWADAVQREQRGDNAHWYDVQVAQTKLAAVEALLPGTDEEFPIFPSQVREALGAEVSDFLLIPRSALAAAADAPQPADPPTCPVDWPGACEHNVPSPAALPEEEPVMCPVTWKPCDCTGDGGCCRLHHAGGRKCADDCVGPVALADPDMS